MAAAADAASNIETATSRFDVFSLEISALIISILPLILASIDSLIAGLCAQRPIDLRVDRVVDLHYRAVDEEKIGALGMALQ